MSQLQQRCVGAASSITRAVDRMVERALVFREVGQADRRQVFVHISTLGGSLYTQFSRERGGVEEELNQERQDADIEPATLTAGIGRAQWRRGGGNGGGASGTRRT